MKQLLGRFYYPAFNFLTIRYWFGQMDTRALSLLRIIFALGMLKVVVYWFFIAELFYSDKGIVPRSVVAEAGRATRLSLLDTLAQPWQVQIFLALWVVVLVNLLLGNYTRWMALLNFIFIVSMHERNIYVLNGADTVMRVLSFWFLFVPLAHYYSLDAVRQRWRTYQTTRNATDLRAPSEPRTGFALPIRFLEIQVAFIYLFTFLLKLPGKPWQDGSALHYALQVQSLMLPSGDWVLENVPYSILQAMTFGTMFFEGAFFIFVFLPFLQPYLRVAALWMGVVMHVGIAVLMAIPNFSTIMLTSYLALCLPQWVERWDGWLRAKRQALGLPLPNPHSPLWVLLAVTQTREITLELSAQQPADTCDAWVVLGSEGQAYHGWAAWREALAHLPLSRLWLWLLRWGWLRRLAWNVASWQTGRAVNAPLSCGERTPAIEWPKLRLATHASLSIVLIWTMVGITWWNLYTVKDADRERIVPPLSQTARSTMQYLGIWQSWGMFSPYPSNNDGWVTVPAVFEDGRQIDLMTGQPVSMEWQHWYWGPERWKKFVSNMKNDAPEEVLKAWGSYYCDLYNKTQALPEGQRLAHFEIVFNSQRSYAPGESPNPIRARTLWKHWCYAQYQY